MQDTSKLLRIFAGILTPFTILATVVALKYPAIERTQIRLSLGFLIVVNLGLLFYLVDKKMVEGEEKGMIKGFIILLIALLLLVTPSP